MTVDYRKFLKDVIRGQRWEFDIPALPGAVDAQGEAVESTREELDLFFELLREVMAEEPETRPSVLREIAKLERECFGDGSVVFPG